MTDADGAPALLLGQGLEHSPGWSDSTPLSPWAADPPSTPVRNQHSDDQWLPAVCGQEAAGLARPRGLLPVSTPG